MKRAEVERELRERLAAHRTMPGVLGAPLSSMQRDQLTAELLPWIMEVVEQAVAEAEMDAGRLP